MVKWERRIYHWTTEKCSGVQHQYKGDTFEKTRCHLHQPFCQPYKTQLTTRTSPFQVVSNYKGSGVSYDDATTHKVACLLGLWDHPGHCRSFCGSFKGWPHFPWDPTYQDKALLVFLAGGLIEMMMTTMGIGEKNLRWNWIASMEQPILRRLRHIFRGNSWCCKHE